MKVSLVIYILLSICCVQINACTRSCITLLMLRFHVQVGRLYEFVGKLFTFVEHDVHCRRKIIIIIIVDCRKILQINPLSATVIQLLTFKMAGSANPTQTSIDVAGRTTLLLYNNTIYIYICRTWLTSKLREL